MPVIMDALQYTVMVSRIYYCDSPEYYITGGIDRAFVGYISNTSYKGETNV
jgi:hypothetical protein